MDNPFLKRATEFLHDDEAFLAIVTPEPVIYFLGEAGETGRLYDRLVVLRGTPGSGKTTLARLFEYPTLAALLRNRNTGAYRALLAALTRCGAVAEDLPAVVGCRLPLETDYRDLWEFPYPDELKLGLTVALIQARAVLGWVRGLGAAGVPLENIEIVPRPGAEAATRAIGGTQGVAVWERARAMELSLYKVVAALVAPDVSELEPDATEAYRPFDVIDRLRVTMGAQGDKRTLELRPLVILDDAHTLHPLQFRMLRRWMARRELRVARWVLSRLDALPLQEVLATVTAARERPVELPGLTSARDTTEILLQSSLLDRQDQRAAFRKMAKDMANRYLRQMPLFSTRNLVSLADLLTAEERPVPGSRLRELQAHADAVQDDLGISEARCRLLLEEVASYRPRGKAPPEDLRLAMLIVLMHRYAKRTPQLSLFGEEVGPEPSRPLTADISVVDAARIHLLHKYDRPFYYGIDDLCDAGSENAEQFLRLAAILVEHVAAQLVRGKPPSLDAATQDRLLRSEAAKVLELWDFPQCRIVRHLVTVLAGKCLQVTREPNAPLGAGANAYGIRQEEFDQIPYRHEDLAHVLRFAIAYNAVSVVPHYSCKGQEWCLIELGGLVILNHGLTLKRGGFIEGSARELASIAEEAAS